MFILISKNSVHTFQIANILNCGLRYNPILKQESLLKKVALCPKFLEATSQNIYLNYDLFMDNLGRNFGLNIKQLSSLPKLLDWY